MLKLFRRAKDPHSDLKELIGNFEIPTMSKVALQVLELLRSPDSKLPEIVSNIEMDPGMNLQILRTVNSAAVGLSQTVKSVQHAITLLGRAQVEALVLAMAVKQTIPEKDDEQFDGHAFWLLSSRRACVARALTLTLNDGLAPEVFTSALLQDVGVPLIAKAHGADHADVVSAWTQAREGLLSEFERRALQKSHIEVGSLLAQHWDLPDYLIDTIAGHEELDEENGIPNSVKLVSVMRGDSVDTDIERVIEACRAVAELDEETLRDALTKASEGAGAFFNAMS